MSVINMKKTHTWLIIIKDNLNKWRKRIFLGDDTEYYKDDIYFSFFKFSDVTKVILNFSWKINSWEYAEIFEKEEYSTEDFCSNIYIT